MDETMYKDLLVELECPICTNYMSPPIRICSTGHSICEPCRTRLPNCPVCQGSFTDSRNISLESLAVKMRYPCINKELGCDLRLAFNARDDHERTCCFKSFKCAMEKCTWSGRLEDIAAHWAAKKTSSKAYHSNNICHTKLKNESYYVNIMEAFGHYFWFKCKLTKKRIYWAVQFIGDASECQNYFYDIEVFKPGRTKKKILLSDYCQSIELENAQLFTENACISVSTDNFDNFVGEDQLLIYYMRVHPVKAQNPQNNTSKPSSSSQGVAAAKKNRDRSKGPPKKDLKVKRTVANRPPANDEDFIVL